MNESEKRDSTPIRSAHDRGAEVYVIRCSTPDCGSEVRLRCTGFESSEIDPPHCIICDHLASCHLKHTYQKLLENKNIYASCICGWRSTEFLVSYDLALEAYHNHVEEANRE